MKKLLSLFILLLVLISASNKLVQANVSLQPSGQQLMNEIKANRKLIGQEVKKQKKIRAQINEKNRQITDLLNALFKEDKLVSQDKITKLEQNETNITKVVAQIINVEKEIKKSRQQLDTYLKQKNYTSASDVVDNILLLTQKESELLKNHVEVLQAYIEFIKSLNYK
jgi:flagellar motor protein MotB